MREWLLFVFITLSTKINGEKIDNSNDIESWEIIIAASAGVLSVLICFITIWNWLNRNKKRIGSEQEIVARGGAHNANTVAGFASPKRNIRGVVGGSGGVDGGGSRVTTVGGGGGVDGGSRVSAVGDGRGSRVSTVGGGGGIGVIAGMSQIFPYYAFISIVAVATAPVPLLFFFEVI